MDKLCSRLGMKKRNLDAVDTTAFDHQIQQKQKAPQQHTKNSQSPVFSLENSQDVQKSPSARSRLATLAQIGEDWLYLALLGTIMALLSFSMDTVITLFLNTRLWLFKDLSEDNTIIQYVGWCLTPIVLVSFSSGFVHLCSPTVSLYSLQVLQSLCHKLLTYPLNSTTGHWFGYT